MNIEVISEFVSKYGPTIGMITSTLAVAVTLFVGIWMKVKPLFDSIKTIKDKVVDDTKENLTNQIQLNNMETQITDLKVKIQNPTISDELKQQYITQLSNLETFYAKVQGGIATVEESKYV